MENQTDKLRQYGQTDKPVEAWHFFTSGGYTYNGGLLVKVGETLKVNGEIIPCKNGLHGSVLAIDALKYAPGAMIQRARYSGVIIQHHDKLAASERTCLWMADTSDVLLKFAAIICLRMIESGRKAGYPIRADFTKTIEAIRDTPAAREAFVMINPGILEDRQPNRIERELFAVIYHVLFSRPLEAAYQVSKYEGLAHSSLRVGLGFNEESYILPSLRKNQNAILEQLFWALKPEEGV